MGKMGVSELLHDVHWLGRSGFRVSGGKIIYIDPYELGEGGAIAELILVTHEHSDHLSPDDIAKISEPRTVVVTTAAAAGQLSGCQVQVVRVGDVVTVKDVLIEVVPAYNVVKMNHPMEAGGVGFVFTANGVRIYHAGDTDLIPEMRDVRADVALLPIGGTYTMDADEAAEAANTIMPKVAVPMHWNSSLGGQAAIDRFQQLCHVPVRVLSRE